MPWNWTQCRSVMQYEKLNRIGEGTYGVVYRARDKETGEIVALKRIRLAKRRPPSTNGGQAKRPRFNEEGFPVTALREVLLLQRLDHPNVIRLREVVVKNASKVEDNTYFLVFDYCENDLGRVLDDLLWAHKQKFSERAVKGIMTQILNGLEYLHSQWVIHRDLKVSNLLYNSKGEVKLADFGLARNYGSPLGAYTPRVVTLWYRAPELLLHDRMLCDPHKLPESRRALKYTAAIDLWAAGCIFGELLLGKPLLPGKDEVDQLHRIFDLLGTPNDSIWPGYSETVKSHVVRVGGQPYSLLRQVFPKLSELGLDLLGGLLTYNPALRYTASEALNHEFFSERPRPSPPESLPVFPPAHVQ